MKKKKMVNVMQELRKFHATATEADQNKRHAAYLLSLQAQKPLGKVKQ